MSLLLSVFAGLSGALLAVLWNGLVSARWLRRLSAAPAAPAPHGEDGARSVLARIAGYALGGAGLGLLYWLGWGLVALVDVPWPVAGLAFGALAWSATVAPALATLALGPTRLPPRPLLVHAVEWLVACLGAGLFAAQAWARLA